VLCGCLFFGWNIQHLCLLLLLLFVVVVCCCFSSKYFSSSSVSNDTSAAQTEGSSVWTMNSDYGFTCANTEELKRADACSFLQAGGKGLFEVSDISCTAKAANIFRNENEFLFAPSKCTMAGGQILSALSMHRMTHSNTGLLEPTTQEEMLLDLTTGMDQIFDECSVAMKLYEIDMYDAANVAGFSRIAHSMINQGYV
jgi:glutamate dehydrogenase (NADP+)